MLQAIGMEPNQYSRTDLIAMIRVLIHQVADLADDQDNRQIVEWKLEEVADLYAEYERRRLH